MEILLLQLKRIGDLILTTPAIAALRAQHPKARISLVVASDTRPLLPAIEGVDEVFVARKKISDAANWFTVARRRYDYCFDFTRNDRSAFLTVLSGATNRVTADHPRLRAKLRSLSYNVLVDLDVGRMHTIDYHLGLLQPLGIRDASTALHLRLPAEAIAEAEAALAAHKIAGNFVLLHPGSARAEKFWEAERWAEIIAWANAQKLACILSGSPAALEQGHLQAIAARATEPFVSLAGKLSLLGLAALIARARLLVTVDSAPMHFAAASGTPQVVLFGPTNPTHWHPRGTPALVLQAGHDAPTTVFRPKEKGAPMNLISTAQVIDAMEALLAAPPVAPL